MKKFIFTLYLCLIFSQVFSLNYKKAINNNKANKKFYAEEYTKSEELHKENSIEYPEDSKIHFNLGDAYYKNEKYDEAIFEYQKSLKNKKLEKSDIFYNIGNAYFQKQDYKNALKHYKNSLLENPNNVDAKYNFELTKQFLQKQKQQKQDKNNQNKDKKNQEKKQNKKEKKEQSEKEEDQKNEEQQKQQQNKKNEQEQQTSQEKVKNAERILDAMQRIENENQKKMTKKIMKTGKVKPVEKNY